jgi:AraC-like DNA-binding protein
MVRLHEVLASPSLRLRIELAARLIDAELRHLSIAEPPDELDIAPRERVLFVHDFRPDPDTSLRWLSEAAHASPAGATVFALLETPVTPTLDRLMRSAHHLSFSGVAIADEVDATALADRLRAAFEHGTRRSVQGLLVQAWKLSPLLARLGEIELSTPRPHATLHALLCAAGVGRKRFVHEAKEVGFDPPLRFFRALRLVQATALLQERVSVHQVSHLLGYSNPSSLSRHFRRDLGIGPRQAGGLGVEDVAHSLAPSEGAARISSPDVA